MKWSKNALFLSSIGFNVCQAQSYNLSATVTQTAPAYQPTNATIFQLSSDPQFAFYLSEVLSLSEANGANTGELLRIATQVVPGDIESTYTAFGDMAQQIEAMAAAANVTKDPVGVRNAYFRASTYWRGADFFLIGNQTDPRNFEIWEKVLDTFNHSIALLEPAPGERFKVKAHSPNVGDFEAIGVFYKASACNESRPTILVGSGYDGSQEESYHSFIRDILARGLNAVTYEGPGQPTVRREQGLGFIPDWNNVVTPVVDYLSTRSDVDMSKLALVGVSFGGNLAPLAASKEHRFSAVVAIDGLPNLKATLAAQFGPKLVDLYNSGNHSAFDETLLSIRANTSKPTQTRWLIDQSLWAFNTQSPSDWWGQLPAFTWTNETVANLPMPIFVAKAQDDTQTGTQPELAHQMLTSGRKNGAELTTYHEFLTDLGAGEHCSVGAEAQQSLVYLDWLADVWGIDMGNNPIS